MDPVTSESKIQALLRTDAADPLRVRSRESSHLEFKRSFSWLNKAEYARTLAGFANAEGGCIVFGVADKPRKIVGLGSSRFDDHDPAIVARYLANAFSHELDVAQHSFERSGFRLGALLVSQARERPVICTVDETPLRTGDIYFRYGARTERIRYTELRSIIAENTQHARKELLSLISNIARAGVENVGLLRLTDGVISGKGGRLLMSAELLDKVKWVLEGNFSEVQGEGTQTLRVIGDVEVVDTVAIQPQIAPAKPVVIRERDIQLAFLQQETPSPRDARLYVIQALREPSAYLPLYHFAAASRIGRDELIAMAEQEAANRQVLRYLLRRLRGNRIEPVGSPGNVPPTAELQQAIEMHSETAVPDAESRTGFQTLQALTHLPNNDADSIAAAKRYLARIVDSEAYGQLSSPKRSLVRKAIARLDEQLNYDLVT